VSGPPSPGPSWHSLLAPLPPDARPDRKPVAPPELAASPTGAAIAGWENLSLHLSAGAHGLRHLLVVLDESGRAIAASDHVYLRWEEADDASGRGRMRQESIGGRIESDGRFLGTCWTVAGPEPREDEAPAWEYTPRGPSDEEISRLRSLVAELMARAP
jgi:hypothetical protein